MSIISDEDLRAILAGFEVEVRYAFGYMIRLQNIKNRPYKNLQEVEHLSRSQLENYAVMFGILLPTEDTASQDLVVAERTDEVAVDIDEIPVLPTPVESEGESAPIVREVDDIEEVQESIKSFCELVGIDSSTARGYLEVLVPAIRI